jgi:hypothetical protein
LVPRWILRLAGFSGLVRRKALAYEKDTSKQSIGVSLHRQGHPLQDLYMKTFYRINARLSADAGAKGPLRLMTDLASAANSEILWGEHYGQDYLPCPEDPAERTIVEELMREGKLVYEVVDKLPYYLQGYVL